MTDFTKNVFWVPPAKGDKPIPLFVEPDQPQPKRIDVSRDDVKGIQDDGLALLVAEAASGEDRRVEIKNGSFRILQPDNTWTRWMNMPIQQGGGGNSLDPGCCDAVNVPIVVVDDFTVNAINANDFIRIDDAGPVVVTLPSDTAANIPIGFNLTVFREGAGAVSFAAGAGATMVGTGTQISAQYGMATVIKYAADTWAVSGNLS